MESSVRELTEFRPDRPVTLTIGVFDGVHLGHQHLIREVVRRARAANRLAGVITFYPHPRLVLQPDMTPAYLTSLDDRIRLIRWLGVDRVATLNFTRELAQLSPVEFLDLVQSHLRVEELVVGHDFALGRNRTGTLGTLQQLGRLRNFAVHGVGPFHVDGLTVSSTLIRQAIQEGDMAAAARYLGRYFCLEGEVIHGDQRGRTIGFPTANLTLPPKRIQPATGIYVTETVIDGRTYGSVTNVGYRPTVNNRGFLIEANVFDFSGDLYGKIIRVDLIHRLREEKKFGSLAELTAQIARDAEDAREFLRRRPALNRAHGPREGDPPG
ncbi:MAG TPA: bifunctional riboflavin kinase/FAD synthetase [Dehalococcoidia bacterium]|nr:bifunctional riboflavin kinase/FAD synthetase [Dehalococcoidia bacterium]